MSARVQVTMVLEAEDAEAFSAGAISYGIYQYGESPELGVTYGVEDVVKDVMGAANATLENDCGARPWKLTYVNAIELP